MRILVLASTYPRFRNDHEPIFVQNLCQELTQEFEVDVLVPHAPNIPRRERQDGVNIYRYRYAPQSMEQLAYDGGILMNLKRKKWTGLLVPLFMLSQFIAAAKLLRVNSYAAIHAHWIIPQGLVAVLLKILLKKDIPILLTSHGGDLFGLKARPLHRIKRWVMQHSAHLTVVSEAMKSYCIKQLDVDANKITVRSMGVDLRETFTPPSSNFDRGGLIYVGRLVEKKGVEYLIRALPKIVKIHPQVTLTVVGEGPLKSEFQNLANTLGMAEHIVFTGGLSNSRIPEILRSHSIAILPSDGPEGLGLVSIEALGCECAVVASNFPAIRDVITDGESGLLVNPADSDSLAEKIILLLDSPTYARQIARNGRQKVLEKFDWSIVGQEYRRVLRVIIGLGEFKS